MLKRYIVFAFDPYGQAGGWDDVLNDGVDADGSILVRSFDSIEEARHAARGAGPILNTDIVDLHTGQIVEYTL